MRATLAIVATGLCLWLVAPVPAAFPAHVESTTSPQREIEEYLDGIKDAGYAFAVSVSLDDKMIVQRGYGFADSTALCPTGERTLFNIASINKSFTAIAAFQLRRAGKLRFEDTLPVIFREVPDDKKSISIEQLLTHTSGLPERYSSDGVKTRDDAIRVILADTLASAPGAAFGYSGENYELLAAIVELRSGVPYEKYVRANILEPAGMTDTRFWAEVAPRADCPVASVREEPSGRGTRDWGYLGSGGIYSNVADLHRWFGALIAAKLLRPDDLDAMWEPRLKGRSVAIARGWFVSQTQGTQEIWTRGNESWGHNAVLRWFPERRLLVIVETNSGELGDKGTTGNRLISDRIVQIALEHGTNLAH